MSAVAKDFREVEAKDRLDAYDVAVRRWQDEGYAVLVVVSTVPIEGRPGMFRVTAVIRVGL